jgi:dienelactone hydrolase
VRWLRRIGIGVAVVVLVAVAWEPTRVAMQTAVMLPGVLGSGVRPLDWFSEEPHRSSIAYRAASAAEDERGDLAELWLPAWASEERPAGAVLLVFGVNNLGRNHPAIQRVAEALARTGVAVLVPDSRTLLEGRLEAGEIDGVVDAFETLTARPEVDPERAGIFGFSVGGSLALLAASSDRIAADVRWVNAFGAYADAATYLAAVSAHEHASPDADGGAVPWVPTPLARQVYLRFMLDQVDDADDRAALEDAYAEAILSGDRPDRDPAVTRALATDVGRTVERLLTARSLDESLAAIGSLPIDSRAFLDAISPIRHLDGLSAPVWLMHEREDHHVPYVESRVLADAFRERGILEEHTEFRLFDHVQPDDLDILAAAPELWRLLLHVRELMEQSL